LNWSCLTCFTIVEFHREKDKLKGDLKEAEGKVKDHKKTLKEANEGAEVVKRETESLMLMTTKRPQVFN
jgi:uncharacterized protein YeeX (DUF496 family)